jgi:hypothetical protein
MLLKTKLACLIAGLAAMAAVAFAFTCPKSAYAGEDAQRAAVSRDEQSAGQVATLTASNAVFYQQLDSYATYMPVMEIADHIDKELARNPDELPVALAWAQNRVNFDVKNVAALDGLHFMILSDLSARSGRREPDPGIRIQLSHDAYHALLIFDALLATDIARCADSVTGGAAVQLLDTRYRSLARAAASLSPAEAKQYWTDALAFEAAAAGRPRNAEICSNGIVARMAEQMAASDAAESLAKAQDSGESALAAGSVPVPESSSATPDLRLQKITPNYLDDAAWKKARDKTRAQLLESWKERYAAAKQH